VLEDWICHAILPGLAYGCLFAAGLFFRAHPGAALYYVAATALVLLYVGIHNAWDAALYIAGKSQEQ
jgi:ABC-type Mn2+/Zn2+ transport system permease subunit